MEGYPWLCSILQDMTCGSVFTCNIHFNVRMLKEFIQTFLHNQPFLLQVILSIAMIEVVHNMIY